MSLVRLTLSMSLDGFSSGPRQSVEDPLGVGGPRLHDWAFALAAWREEHGMEGGVENESTAVLRESRENVGATVMGRNMFGGGPGPWPEDPPWDGWWGTDPPYHHPVFVVTHHPREPLVCKGGTTFTFATDGVAAALERAREAAGGRDVSLAGGAAVARAALDAELVDRMEINLVPVLLGAGDRPLDGLGAGRPRLAHVRTVAAPGVMHLMFARA